MTVVEKANEGLTIKAAAADVGVHFQTIRNWMAKYDENPADPSALPYTQFGAAAPGTRRIVKIHPDDLQPFKGRAGSS